MRRLLGSALVAAACAPQSSTSCPSGVLVVSTDEQLSTMVGVLPLDGTPAALVSGTELGSDPVLATSAGRHFLINRSPGADVLFELDSCGHGISQVSTLAYQEPAPSDPQDVAVAPDGSLWIARLLRPSLFVTRATPTTIDLSQFDADGNPDASSVRIVGQNAFVALERLTNDVSQQPSQIVVLDTTSLALVTTITLKGRNPFGLMTESAGRLWLAEPGNFSDASEADAGIEVVDTTAMTSTLLMSEATLGASVTELAVSAIGAQAPGQVTGCGAAIVADATPNVNRTSLVSFSLDGKTFATALGPTDGFDLRGLAWTSDGKLLVGDKRPGQSGFPVHVFTASPPTCVLEPGPDLAVPFLPALAFAPQ